MTLEWVAHDKTYDEQDIVEERGDNVVKREYEVISEEQRGGKEEEGRPWGTV